MLDLYLYTIYGRVKICGVSYIVYLTLNDGRAELHGSYRAEAVEVVHVAVPEAKHGCEAIFRGFMQIISRVFMVIQNKLLITFTMKRI